MKRLAIITTLLTLMAVNAYSQAKQFLYIKFEPADATLEINEQRKSASNGIYQELLPFGNYIYKLSKNGYTTSIGSVKISDPYNTHCLEIKLKKPIGYLSIPNKQSISGAAVYIDDNYVGNLPLQNHKIASGYHKLSIVHPLFHTYMTGFEIEDECNRTIIPTLSRSHVVVTLETNSGAEIYVDNLKQGTGKCKDTLAIDTRYRFESRKVSHESNAIYHTVTLKDDNRTINVPAPTPIYGSLKITSTLPDATIYLDGKNIGKTPYEMSQILIGEHRVSVKYKNYNSPTKSVNICKGQKEEVHFEIPHGSLALTSNPPEAKIYIDGQYVGVTPKYIPALWPGNHTVKFEYNNHWYESETKTVTIAHDKHSELSLNKECGSLYVSSNQSARLYINDKEVGDTPMKLSAIWVGEYTVTVKHSSGETQTKTINITKGKETKVNFEKADGSLFVTSIPDNATVIIDGKSVGKTPLYMPKILSGEHKVTVTYPTGESQTKNITIEPGIDSELGFESQFIDNNPQESKINPAIDGTMQNARMEDSEKTEDIDIVEEEAIPFQLVEEKPSFQGGDANQFSMWVNQRLVYPEIAKENGVQGRVTIQFTVEKDGSVTKVKVLRGIDPSLDKEAIRVVSMSPKWTPGKQRNRTVPVTYTFPVIFQLR